MENSIKELIDSATINGTISDAERNYIIKKANDLGIDEIEVNIFINANLKKNTSNSSNQANSINTILNSDGWLTFKDFNKGNWVMFIGILLLFIAGFLPWVQGKISSSGFGSSYGHKGSVGGGFFYTFPLTIAGVFFAMKNNLTKYRIYFGPFVFLVMIGLIASYTSRHSASYGGISASASTKAGPGVILMGISGIIYLIGALILDDKNSKLTKIFTHQKAFIVYLIILTLAPVLMKNFRLNLASSITLSLIWGGLPLLITKYKQLPKTQKVMMGNIIFWVIVIILPRHSDLSFINYTRKVFDNYASLYLLFYFLISSAAIASDYYESTGKSLEKLAKIQFLFNSKIIALTLLIPISIFATYSTLTKHEVTYEEFDKFNHENSKFEGYWYFLNSDTTKIERLNISNENSICQDESGDIDIKFITYFDESNSIKLNKYEFEFKSKLQYDEQIKFPVKFENSFEVQSCDSTILKANITNINGEKINIIAIRESSQLDNLIQEKINRVASQTITNEIYTIPIGDFIVKNVKCFFYSEPNLNMQKNSYLVNGDSGTYSQIENGFVYAVFNGSNGVTSEGWISIDDIEIQSYGE